MRARANGDRTLVSTVRCIFWVFVLFPASAFSGPSETPKAIEDILQERLKALELVASQISRDTDPAFEKYKVEIGRALADAKAELPTLKSDENVQKCNNGVDRWNTCVAVLKSAKNILDAAFDRHRVPQLENELRAKLGQAATEVDRSGLFSAVPEIDTNQGVLRVVKEDVFKKLLELQAAFTRAWAKIGMTALRATTTSLINPMSDIAQVSRSEKIDSIEMFSNSFDAAIAELNIPK